MSDIDWSKAPEGATHFSPKPDKSWIWCEVFWRFDGDSPSDAWRVEDDGGRTHIMKPSITEECRNRLIERPRPVIWDGTGLPPVGVLIEARHKDATPEWAKHDFHETTIAAMRNVLAIFVDQDGRETVGKIEDYLFRPIRTPEQIAAEERLSAIAEMMKHVVHATPYDCEMLYKAGYRKVE